MLATGGGLLFTGKYTGEFIAMDADTGEDALGVPDRAPGSTRMPITWTQNGRQYVTVLSGLGGLYGTSGRARLAHVPLGGSVWTFALPQD